MIKNTAKIYLSLLFLAMAGVCSLKAQITVTQADMPQPGDTIRVSTDNVNTGLPNPTLTGASYTWDYTKLVPYTQTIDTFLSVTSTPFAYQLYFNDIILYPKYKATVAQSAPNLPALGPITINQVIDFYKATSSDYENVGFGANINSIPTSVKDDTIDYMYRFPMKYGNADSSHSSFKLSIPGIGFYGQRQYRVNHVDGWGTLKTPFGTFNTLRITTLLYVTDSIYIDTFHYGLAVPQPQQIQYKWFGNGSRIPLLQVNEQVISNNPVFTSAVYQDSIRYTILGVSQVNASHPDVTVFPNPSKGQFNVVIRNYQLGMKNNLEIYNMLGERVKNEEITGENTIIDLTDQAKGLYLYRVIDGRGNLISSGKIIVQ